MSWFKGFLKNLRILECKVSQDTWQTIKSIITFDKLANSKRQIQPTCIIMAKITVEQKEITIISNNQGDFISLTDMANAKESESRAADIIKNWIRTRYTLEFLGTWEQIKNPNFKVVEFDHFKTQAGLPNFVLSATEWIEKTNAVGLIVKKGKYGGTYAHKDIAFEFGSAISVTFKLYLINEFQRLKEEEQKQLGW